MKEKDAEFLKKLLSTFEVEADEHLRAITVGLLLLEKAQILEDRLEIAESLLREAHSLKGAASSVNLPDAATLCQAMESIFSALKRQEMAMPQHLFDSLHESVSVLQGLVSRVQFEESPEEKLKTSSLVRETKEKLLGLIPTSGATEQQPAPLAEIRSAPKNSPVETLRVAAKKLDSLFYQAEEMVSAKLDARQREIELQELRERILSWKKEWARMVPEIRAFRAKTEFSKFSNFFDWNRDYVKLLEGRIANLITRSQQDSRMLSSLVDHLLEDAKKVLMFPFSSVLESFPKLVREISREQGKDVQLVLRGESIEIDRRILQEIKDPLIHLVRNAIDHGIEKPEKRVQAQKSPAGTIKISISQRESNKVEIVVSDDGEGVDIQEVRREAVRLGILTEEEAEQLGREESFRLIFLSGISTSPILTDISGRGVGMAIVKEKVQALGGSVFVDSNAGKGTTFRMLLPLTLATFRGILVQVNERLFVLPSNNVDFVLRIRKDDVKTVESRETIEFQGEALPLVQLGAVLELPQKQEEETEEDFVTAVLISNGDSRVALEVDRIAGEQEILVKNLGKQLARVRNIAAATVLGTGQVVPILNVHDLIQSAIRLPSGVARTPEHAIKAEPKKKSVLIAEDSITARTLLKNILESVGYQVKTAVDGTDALTLLKTESFDLVVSDVDMPRMNGFELTARIRSEKKLSDLPVILVTALESREDRERGIDAGANAYIIKSSFDQSNLLEAVERVI